MSRIHHSEGGRYLDYSLASSWRDEPLPVVTEADARAALDTLRPLGENATFEQQHSFAGLVAKRSKKTLRDESTLRVSQDESKRAARVDDVVTQAGPEALQDMGMGRKEVVMHHNLADATAAEAELAQLLTAPADGRADNRRGGKDETRHDGGNQNGRADQRLRAILRAPAEIQDLYREDPAATEKRDVADGKAASRGGNSTGKSADTRDERI